VAVNPLTSTVYVTDEFSNTIYLLNTHTDKVTSTFTVGNNLPFVIGVNPLTATAYVANRGNNTVSLITN
jgi:YVTN family beta-propeller protein